MPLSTRDANADDELTSEFEFAGRQFVVISYPRIPPSIAARLTSAEREVVEGVLDDLSDVEIAARRGTAARTVQNQLSSVYRKLGVASRGELSSRLRDGEPR